MAKKAVFDIGSSQLTYRFIVERDNGRVEASFVVRHPKTSDRKSHSLTLALSDLLFLIAAPSTLSRRTYSEILEAGKDLVSHMPHTQRVEESQQFLSDIHSEEWPIRVRHPGKNHSAVFLAL